MTPSWQSHPHPLPHLSCRHFFLFVKKLSGTLPRASFFSLFSTLFFLHFCPSICAFVFFFFPLPSSHSTPPHPPPLPPHCLISLLRVTSHSSMGLLPPSPSSCLLPCLCFEAVCCGSTNERVRRTRRTSFDACMHVNPGRRQRKKRSPVEFGVRVERHVSGSQGSVSLPKVRRQCQER